MADGLGIILTRIKEQPAMTLVGRYLSLLADVEDDEQKIDRALDLAEAIVQPLPSEALRIAHMVHQADRENLRALDVMIATFRERGRHGKAEVLKNERDRVAAAQEAAGGRSAGVKGLVSRRSLLELASSAGRDVEGEASSGPSESSSSFGIGSAEASKMAEIDLGEGPELDLSDAQLDLLFPAGADGALQPGPAQSVERVRAGLNQALAGDNADQRPSDTVLPVGEGVFAVGAPLSSYFEPAPPPPLQVPDPQQHLPLPAPGAPGGASPARPTPSNRELEEQRRTMLAATRDLFDHYWRQGFISEAKALLEKVAPLAQGEPWWQSRRVLVEQVKVAGSRVSQVASPGTPGNSAAAADSTRVAPAAAQTPRLEGLAGVSPAPGQGAPAVRAGETAPAPMRGHDFLRPLFTEVARLSRSPLFEPPAAVVPSAGARDLVAAVDPLARALGPLQAGQMPGVGATDAPVRLWELLSATFGGAPDSTCAALLERMHLKRASSAYWGLYLDALLAAGRPRRAQMEVLACLNEQSGLDWATVAWRRLPGIWRALRQRGFAWDERQGVAALVNGLRRRPKPQIRTLMACGTAANGLRQGRESG